MAAVTIIWFSFFFISVSIKKTKQNPVEYKIWLIFSYIFLYFVVQCLEINVSLFIINYKSMVRMIYPDTHILIEICDTM